MNSSGGSSTDILSTDEASPANHGKKSPITGILYIELCVSNLHFIIYDYKGLIK